MSRSTRPFKKACASFPSRSSSINAFDDEGDSELPSSAPSTQVEDSDKPVDEGENDEEELRT
jgi:hypothetical protein